MKKALMLSGALALLFFARGLPAEAQEFSKTSFVECVKNRSMTCMLEFSLDHGFRAEKRKKPLTATAETDILKDVILLSDEKLSRRFLSLMSDDDDLSRMQLLFNIGEYEEASKLLVKLQNERKWGGDYGAVYALVRRGDYDEALRIAEQTKDWRYINPNPPPAGQVAYSSAGWGCGQAETLYPRALGGLALKFLSMGDDKKAGQAFNFLRYYKLSGYAGKEDNSCIRGATDTAILDYMLAKAERLVDRRQTEEALQQYFQAIFANANPYDTSYKVDGFHLIARSMIERGLADEALFISRLLPAQGIDPYMCRVRAHRAYVPLEHNTGYNLSVPILIAVKADDYGAAFKQVESLPCPNARLSAAFYVAEKAYDKGKLAELNDILSQLPSYIDQRESLEDRIEDYLLYARFLAWMDRKQEALAYLAKAMDLSPAAAQQKASESSFRLSAPSYRRSVALLYGDLGDFKGFQSWAIKQGEEYKDPDIYIAMFQSFAERGRWDLFDGLSKELEAFPNPVTGNDKFQVDILLGKAGLLSKYANSSGDRYDDAISQVHQLPPNRDSLSAEIFVKLYLQKDNAQKPDLMAFAERASKSCLASEPYHCHVHMWRSIANEIVKKGFEPLK